LRKIVIFSLVAVMVVALSGIAIVSAKPDLGEKGLIGPAGKSNNAFMELWEKDPSTWDIIDDGAWGKMKYHLTASTFNFLFNGHGLEPGTEYSLIYYPDPWPGDGLIILGTATVNDEGNIHIKGSVDTGDLPIETDENEGAKIWLVLSSDVDEVMTGWNPTEYLFEFDLIMFDDTSDNPEVASSKPGKPEKEMPPKSNKYGNSGK
jgi:hypothetical protein